MPRASPDHINGRCDVSHKLFTIISRAMFHTLLRSSSLAERSTIQGAERTLTSTKWLLKNLAKVERWAGWPDPYPVAACFVAGDGSFDIAAYAKPRRAEIDQNVTARR
jgi:hypothetical protein